MKLRVFIAIGAMLLGSQCSFFSTGADDKRSGSNRSDDATVINDEVDNDRRDKDRESPYSPELTQALDGLALYGEHCASCHGQAEDSTKTGRSAKQIASAIESIGDMQHLAELLSDEDIAAIAKTLSVNIENLCLQAPEAPAINPALRRLTRRQYVNTIRDLFGVDVDPATLPEDDQGYGFANDGTIQTMSPLHIERYLDAARIITTELFSGTSGGNTNRYQAEAMAGTTGQAGNDSYNLWSNGSISRGITVANGGAHTIRVRAWASQAGPDPANMEIHVDGVPVADFDVPAVAANPMTVTTTVNISAGSHSIGAAFTNDYYNPDDPDPNNRDRNLYVDWIEVDSPGSAALPASLTSIVSCDPVADGSTCANEIVQNFAALVWRRPLTAGDQGRLFDLLDAAAARSNQVWSQIAIAMQGVLASPHFLYLIEAEGGDRPLNNHELASRLSYFIWASAPDATLRELADSGELSEPANLKAQVERLLADDRSRGLSENFLMEWLGLRSLEGKELNPDVAGGFDAGIFQSMQRETQLFFAEILREEMDLRRLIDAEFSYINGDLAQLYGIPNVSGADFQRVSLADTQRAGLLTQASVLSATAGPRNTLPVLRGKWVLDQMLCRPPAPPPADVNTELEEGESGAETIKEQLEHHRSNPACASCHAVMDPLGLGLENFDPLGRFREVYTSGDPVENAGQLPTGEKFATPRELINIIAEDQQVANCVTEKMLSWGLATKLQPRDQCRIIKVRARALDEGFTATDLITEIVLSRDFLERMEDAP